MSFIITYLCLTFYIWISHWAVTVQNYLAVIKCTSMLFVNVLITLSFSHLLLVPVCHICSFSCKYTITLSTEPEAGSQVVRLTYRPHSKCQCWCVKSWKAFSVENMKLLQTHLCLLEAGVLSRFHFKNINITQCKSNPEKYPLIGLTTEQCCLPVSQCYMNTQNNWFRKDV